jgi:hypothetical protein
MADNIILIFNKNSFGYLIIDKLLWPSRVIVIDDRAKGVNMSNMGPSIMPGFKGSLFKLWMWAIKVKIGGILNSFRPEFKIKSRILKDRSGLIVESLTKTFRGTVYL